MCRHHQFVQKRIVRFACLAHLTVLPRLIGQSYQLLQLSIIRRPLLCLGRCCFGGFLGLRGDRLSKNRQFCRGLCGGRWCQLCSGWEPRRVRLLTRLHRSIGIEPYIGRFTGFTRLCPFGAYTLYDCTKDCCCPATNGDACIGVGYFSPSGFLSCYPCRFVVRWDSVRRYGVVCRDFRAGSGPGNGHWGSAELLCLGGGHMHAKCFAGWGHCNGYHLGPCLGQNVLDEASKNLVHSCRNRAFCMVAARYLSGFAAEASPLFEPVE